MIRVLLVFALFVASSFASDPPPKEISNTIGMVVVGMNDGCWVDSACWVGKYEVTQKEYLEVTGKNPSKFKADNHPVERVNWHDAMAFCKALTEKERKAGKLPKGFVYSLPTEKQWEQFVGDASLEDAVHARFGKNREPLGPLPVGSRKPNQFGLHDVRGNVWEWCLDDYMANSTWKVLRGGAWSVSDPDNMEIGIRLNVEPETAYEFYGFRCVLIGGSAP